ncbi:MAG: alpha/beta fold hydrolase [Trueperaceae bacterium]
MRARQPDQTGFGERDGVPLYWEVHGNGEPAFLLLPTWSMIHSRVWKMQVPYLARHGRVVTFDGRGNGRSGRPQASSAYLPSEFAQDALAVMEATGTEDAIMVGFSAGAQWLLELLRTTPAKVKGAVFIGPALPFGGSPPGRYIPPFDERPAAFDGWAKYNRHFWREDYEGFLRFFSGQCFSEPHSTKGIDDCVAWGLETDAETLLHTQFTKAESSREPVLQPDEARAIASAIDRPVLILHGSDDRIRAHRTSVELAELARATLVTFEGSGHAPHARDPVRANLELRAFAESLTAPEKRPRAWPRALGRPQRALFISSPIGLGHVQRDLAIVRSLRQQRPGLEVHWWAQHPVTRVLEEAGEYVHPASHAMASESQHWEEESTSHELHAFYAFRRMDEIFLANFMAFHELVSEEPYDLWIGDESWEIDYYLHENPELKRAPYVFLTDVIGFLPVDPEGDPREAELTADYNAEMIEQRSRFPWLRDLSLYVGDFEDLPDACFGQDLPRIRDWARSWFEEVGYVLPFDSDDYRDTAALRRRLAHPEDGTLLFAAVGGTAVGKPLLEKIAAAFDILRRRRPDVRMVMVTGPRIDPAELIDVQGLEKRPYVHNLFEHLACADAAVVQGGLSTTMELVASRRPFVYFPLRNHWEQVHHVTARLNRYGAHPPLDYAATDPETLAAALEGILDRPVAYRPVPGDGASRAASRIASLLGPPR